jgi:hypothetical protein
VGSVKHGLAVAAVLALAGCGYVGPPQPPALNIPAGVTDLAAGEYGANVLVRFTLPALTTEGLTLKNVRSVELFIGPGPSPFSTDAWAASARRVAIPGPPEPGPVMYQAPAADWIGKTVIIGVRATGPTGKLSGWSNFRVLTVGTPLVRPAAVKAENLAGGVGVTWQGSGPRYRVLRAVEKSPLMVLGETNQPNYLDETTSYGTQYTYQVLAIQPAEANDSQQSEISEPAVITPVDAFAPAVPMGVTASAGVNSIELAWVRNTESDLQGYNVYRSVEGSAFEKAGELVPTPVFSDMQVESGKHYRYAVSAVDTTGNESARSEAVEVVAP